MTLGWLIAVIIFVISALASLFERGFTGGASAGPDAAVDAMIDQLRLVNLADDTVRAAIRKAATTTNAAPVVRYEDIPGRLEYERGRNIVHAGVHYGQRKLFLTELSFLARHAGRDGAVVVYAGGGPNVKGAFLAELFPEVTFLLIDPAGFTIAPRPGVVVRAITDVGEVDSSANIFTLSDFMTVPLGARLREQFAGRKVFFWSDIRTRLTAEATSAPGSVDIQWNLVQQFLWVREMKPTMAMLKFRFPFGDEPPEEVREAARGPPFVEDFEAARAAGFDALAELGTGRMTYFAGDIFVQPWAPVSSTETRLETPGTAMRVYDIAEYDSRFFYYNNLHRALVHTRNDHANAATGFDHCNDCALEAVIWESYAALFGGAVSEYVARLSAITGRDLFEDSHGRLFGPLDFARVKEITHANDKRRDRISNCKKSYQKAWGR